MKPIIKIPTTGDLQLNIQKVKCHAVNSEGRKRTEDEICLLISGDSSENENIIEEFVTISKSEARNLANILLDMASE